MIKQYVAFSGGVDSTALALLFPSAIPVFTDTGWEFPELYAHLDKFQTITGRDVIRLQSKHGTLPEYIERMKYLPNHGARFCTRLFKIETYNEWLSDKLPAEMLIGLRADEPDRTGNQTLLDGLVIRYPFREAGLTRLDCVKICLENDLLPRYPAYMARGGCIGCFYKRKSKVLALRHYHPDLLAELQRIEESVQDERGKFFHMFPNIGMSIADLNATLEAQLELFNTDDLWRDAGDNSDKGNACGLFCHK